MPKLFHHHNGRDYAEVYAGIGDKLSNGTTIVAEEVYARSVNSIGAPVKESYVLAVKTHPYDTHYVTWYRRVEYGQSATGGVHLLDVTYYGHYHSDLRVALKDMEERAYRRSNMMIEPVYEV